MDKKESIVIEDRKIGSVYSMFTNAGLVMDYDSGLPIRDDDNGEVARFTINDLLVSQDLTRFIPTVVQMIVREAIEPNLLMVPNLFTQLNIPNGRMVQIGAIGSLHAAEIPEGAEYPTQDLDLDGGHAVSVTATKHGLQIRFTEEVIEDSSWDIVGMWLRAAGKALARHKEVSAARLIDEMGVTVFDNASPTTTADPDQYGTTTGRDISGAANGSMTLNDIFDLYAFLAMRGFTPDTLIMHPLAWKVFAIDPEVREIVLRGNTLATRRMPAGTYSAGWATTHEGRGLRTAATGQTSLDVSQGKVGANPWVSTLNPLGATFNAAPQYLPSPMTVLVSPYVAFKQAGATVTSVSYPTTTIMMCQSDACGILVQKTPVGVDEWDDPARDISAMKIRERWGMQLLEQGRGVAVARNVVVARNYVFDNVNSKALNPINTAAAISTIN